MSEKARKPPSDDAPEIILPPAPVVGERMPLRHTLTGSGQTCSACKHFRQEDSRNEWGACHINPPMPFLVPDRDMTGRTVPRVLSGWPPVRPDQDCGQWSPKAQARN